MTTVDAATKTYLVPGRTNVQPIVLQQPAQSPKLFAHRKCPASSSGIGGGEEEKISTPTPIQRLGDVALSSQKRLGSSLTAAGSSTIS